MYSTALSYASFSDFLLCLQQQVDHSEMIIVQRRLHRRVILPSLGIDIGSPVQQELHRAAVSPEARRLEGTSILAANRLNIGPPIQQQLHGPIMAPQGCCL